MKTVVPSKVTTPSVLSKVREISPLQFVNATVPIEVTPGGSVMPVNAVQPWNAFLPIKVRLEGSVMSVKAVQPWNV